MDLRQIQYFVALYEEQSITRAARRLNVVQPALSMQISKLEKSYKTRLFERTSRGVIPTDVGRNFYNLCQKILGDVHSARRYLQDASGKITGEVTIGVMPSIASSLVPELLVRYKEEFPEVSLRILEAYSGSLMDMLASGRVDLAVVNNMGLIGGVAVLPLIRDHLVLVTRTASRRGAPVRCPAHSLRDYRLVLPSQRQGMRLLIDSVLASHGIVLKPEIELDSLAPTIDLVRNSDWATILPIVAVKRAADAGLVRIQQIVDPMLPREVVVVHNANRPPSVAGQAFLSMLKGGAEALLGTKGGPQKLER